MKSLIFDPPSKYEIDSILLKQRIKRYAVLKSAIEPYK